MGTLDEVLKYKAQKDAQATAPFDAIANGFMAYNQGQQVARENTLKELTLAASLAPHGMTLTKDQKGNFTLGRDPNLQSPIDLLNAQKLQADIGLTKTRQSYLEQKPLMDAQKQSQKDETMQNSLEKNYLDRVTSVIKSGNSTSYGLANQNVESAYQGVNTIESLKDPKTGEFKVPPSMHTELAMKLARLLGSSGRMPMQMIDELKQKTAQEQVSSMAIYLGADPKQVGGTTQGVTKFLLDSFKRLGSQSQEARDKAIQDVAGIPPMDLAQERVDRIKQKSFGRDFNSYVNGLGTQSNTPMPAKSSAPKGAKGWDTEKGEWVM